MRIDRRLLVQDFIINSTKENFDKYPYSEEMFELARCFAPKEQALIEKMKSEIALVEDYNLGHCSILDALYYLEKADLDGADNLKRYKILSKYGFNISIDELQEYESLLGRIMSTPEFANFIEQTKDSITNFNNKFENIKGSISSRLEKITGESLEDNSDVYFTNSSGFNLRSNNSRVIYAGNTFVAIIHEMLHQQFDERVENSITEADVATTFDERTFYLEKQHPFIRLMAQELVNSTMEHSKPMPYSESRHTKKDVISYPIWYTYMRRNESDFRQKISEDFAREHLTATFIKNNLTPTIVENIKNGMNYWDLWAASNEVEKSNIHNKNEIKSVYKPNLEID